MELKLEGGFPQELVFLHHTQQIHGARAAQVQVSGGEVKPHCVRDLAEEFQMLVPLPHEAIALPPSGLEAEAPQGQHRLFCAGTVRGVGFEHRKDGGQVSLGDIQIVVQRVIGGWGAVVLGPLGDGLPHGAVLPLRDGDAGRPGVAAGTFREGRDHRDQGGEVKVPIGPAGSPEQARGTGNVGEDEGRALVGLAELSGDDAHNPLRDSLASDQKNGRLLLPGGGFLHRRQPLGNQVLPALVDGLHLGGVTSCGSRLCGDECFEYRCASRVKQPACGVEDGGRLELDGVLRIGAGGQVQHRLEARGELVVPTVPVDDGQPRHDQPPVVPCEGHHIGQGTQAGQHQQVEKEILFLLGRLLSAQVLGQFIGQPGAAIVLIPVSFRMQVGVHDDVGGGNLCLGQMVV